MKQRFKFIWEIIQHWLDLEHYSHNYTFIHYVPQKTWLRLLRY